MTKTLKIYTKPGCQYCTAAKAFLKENDIAYEEIDITADPTAVDFLRNQGFKSLPVLFAGDEPLLNGGYNVLKTMRKHEIMERLAA